MSLFLDGSEFDNRKLAGFTTRDTAGLARGGCEQ